MSMISRLGLDGVSSRKAFVAGVTAARHSSRSGPSTSVQPTPKRGSRSSTTQRQDPNSARAATTWSPALTWPMIAAVTAAMPVAVACPISAPSSDGHALFEHGRGRVGIPRVAVARLLVEKACLGALGALVDETLREKQRLRGLTVGGAGLSLVDEARFNAMGLCGWLCHAAILATFDKKNNRLFGRIRCRASCG